jgi:hypothetical protein
MKASIFRGMLDQQVIHLKLSEMCFSKDEKDICLLQLSDDELDILILALADFIDHEPVRGITETV